MRKVASLAVGDVGAALLWGHPAPAAADTIALPASDREALEQLLGKGVIGDPVAASPLAPTLVPLREGSWTYQIVSGDQQGDTERDILTQLKRDQSGASWRFDEGTKDFAFVRRADDDSVAIISEQDTEQGVITRFAPAEPILANGMKPGETKKVTVAVKVYDLSSPNEVSHTGSLDLTYSYIGAYKVTVPAGTYEAVLLKWIFDGKVGPASVADTQYRFIAEDVGIVASIDKKKISALLLYHDDSKYGKVLQTSSQ